MLANILVMRMHLVKITDEIIMKYKFQEYSL